MTFSPKMANAGWHRMRREALLSKKCGEKHFCVDFPLFSQLHVFVFIFFTKKFLKVKWFTRNTIKNRLHASKIPHVQNQ